MSTLSNRLKRFYANVLEHKHIWEIWARRDDHRMECETWFRASLGALFCRDIFPHFTSPCLQWFPITFFMTFHKTQRARTLLVFYLPFDRPPSQFRLSRETLLFVLHENAFNDLAAWWLSTRRWESERSVWKIVCVGVEKCRLRWLQLIMSSNWQHAAMCKKVSHLNSLLRIKFMKWFDDSVSLP